MNHVENIRIAIIGLGYVGLPLAVEFGKKYTTLGFDINQKRISELQSGVDITKEVSPTEFKEALYLSYSSDRNTLKSANIYIITVPTPIDEYKTPDLTALQKASETVGHVIQKGDIVIYESTEAPQKKSVFLLSKNTRDSPSTKTSLPATALNVSTPATKNTASPRSKKSLRDLHQKSRPSSTTCTQASSPPAPPKPAASKSPKPQRSSKIHRETSTLH